MYRIIKPVGVIVQNELYLYLNVGYLLHKVDESKFRLDGTGHEFTLTWKDYYEKVDEMWSLSGNERVVNMKATDKMKEVLNLVVEIEKLIGSAESVIDSSEQYKIRKYLNEAEEKCLKIRNMYDPF